MRFDVKPRGFTLVEALIACALGLVVLTLMVQTLIPTMTASRKAADRVDLHQRAVVLGERMAGDFRISTRTGIGLYPSPGRLRVSIHGRQTDTLQVLWQGMLRVYDWQQERVIGESATLTTPALGPVVPTVAVLDTLSKRETLRVEGVKSFAVALDGGPSVRLTLTMAKGDQILDFQRSIYLRNGSD